MEGSFELKEIQNQKSQENPDDKNDETQELDEDKYYGKTRLNKVSFFCVSDYQDDLEDEHEDKEVLISMNKVHKTYLL